ncbi:ABC transporter I family member 10 isoform X2 [Zingiber officinale]|uniref:ABC transporter I family member 10 isoform X2 n=1 Tax=Zingiber officinale TaxID=94328 RepID=UPI001C4A8279|nr:ABC transporter I family member 10 isoform X2 [Zingiber officinale]
MGPSHRAGDLNLVKSTLALPHLNESDFSLPMTARALWLDRAASISIAPTLPSASAVRCRQSRLVAMQASPASAIEARNLYFSLSNKQGKLVPILKNCSIRVPPGQLWMLLGPNGCGKSTLLKVLAGFLRPDDGIVSVKKPNSFVFQNPDHQVVMPTVEADIAFGLGKFNLTSSEVRLRVSNALEAVGLQSYSQRPIQTLSGGQKQRVAIAGALAEASKVLLLDELTTFLDEHDQMFTRQELWRQSRIPFLVQKSLHYG